MNASSPALQSQENVTCGLRRLTLSNFRNHEYLQLNLQSNLIVLTGINGIGKTNILEAISFLSPGKGLRQAKIQEIERHGAASNWAVSAEINSTLGMVTIGTGRDPLQNDDRRVVRINGQVMRHQSALTDYLHLCWVTPQMDGLFRDEASGRRHFLDQLICGIDPDHASRLAPYDHARQERLKLLKQNRQDATWLETLEDRMARYGVALTAARRDYIARLNASFQSITESFPPARVELLGDLQQWLEIMPALAAEDKFRIELAQTRQQDAETGRTNIGAHRADINVMHLDKNMPAPFCSTGEQKILLLSVILAATRMQAMDKGVAPLLLLDEVIAHLDEGRRRSFLTEIAKRGSQVWLTGTDKELFAGLENDAQFITLDNGNRS